MSRFGETPFAGGGCIRWTLTPFILLFAVLMPLLIDEWTSGRFILVGGIELMCLCLLAGFWLPVRFGYWAFRALAGLIGLAYAAYVTHGFFFNDEPPNNLRNRPNASPIESLIGFVVIGLPCLLYSVFGNFSWGSNSDPEIDAVGPDDDDDLEPDERGD